MRIFVFYKLQLLFLTDRYRNKTIRRRSTVELLHY